MQIYSLENKKILGKFVLDFKTKNQYMKKIIALAGSNSKHSINKILAAYTANLIEGAEVFLIIWKNIPKYNFLYKIFNNKLMFFLLKIFYELAAYFLFLKNKHLLKE